MMWRRLLLAFAALLCYAWQKEQKGLGGVEVGGQRTTFGAKTVKDASGVW